MPKTKILLIFLAISLTISYFGFALGSGGELHQPKLIWRHKVGISTDFIGVTRVAISGDGEYVAAYSIPSKLYLFDRSGKLLWDKTLESIFVEPSLSITKDGSYLLLGGKLFHRNGTQLPLQIPCKEVSGSDISPEGRYAAIGCSYPKDALLLVDLESNLVLWSYSFERRGTSMVISPAVSENASYVAAGIGMAPRDLGVMGVYLFNKHGELLWRSHDIFAHSASICYTGEYIAAGSANGLKIFRNSGELVWSSDGYYGLDSIDLTGNCRYAITSRIRLVDLHGNLTWSYPIKGGFSVSASYDGSYFAVGAEDSDGRWVLLFSTGSQQTPGFELVPGIVAFLIVVLIAGLNCWTREEMR